jgi:soluble lytic murein transglycosylase-like protein
MIIEAPAHGASRATRSPLSLSMPGSPTTAATNWHRGGIRERRRRLAYFAAPLCVVLLALPMLGEAIKTSAGLQPGPAPQPRTRTVSTIFTPEVKLWNNALVDWSDQAGVDPNLAAAVMQIESCGNPFARSKAGAMGLFQVMPDHFAETEDPFSPPANARRALEYLKQSLAAADGDPRLALAGYNGGIGVIAEGEWSWPAETQRYAYWAAGIYRDAIRGASSSRSLTEWLAAGGDSLCRSAREVLNAG